jgi:hypothetical protein
MFASRQTVAWICQACRQEFPFNKFNTLIRSFHFTAKTCQETESIPSGLILRAQKLAQQHRELEQKAAQITDYTPQSIQLYKRISELSQVTTNLKEFENAHKVF